MLDTASVFVTAHAVERYRERVAGSSGPGRDEVLAAVRAARICDPADLPRLSGPLRVRCRDTRFAVAGPVIFVLRRRSRRTYRLMTVISAAAPACPATA